MVVRCACVFACILAAAAIIPCRAAQDAAPPVNIEVRIPDYEVTDEPDGQSVDIPGGETLFELGKPMVPTHVVTAHYPKGFVVQSVAMVERSDLKTARDLRIPNWQPVEMQRAPVRKVLQRVLGWYPTKDFTWLVDENPDGSTDLHIEIYPFKYNAATREARFYRHYTFKAAYIRSLVQIEGMSLTRAAAGKTRLDLLLANAGPAEDFTCSTVVKLEGAAQPVVTVKPRKLAWLPAHGLVSPEIDTAALEPGTYRVEVEVRDKQGRIVARKLKYLDIGAGVEEREPDRARPSPAKPTPPAVTPQPAVPGRPSSPIRIEAELRAEPASYTGNAPATIRFKGSISVSQTCEVKYTYARSDGAAGPTCTLRFDKPGAQEVTTSWTLGKNYEGWMAIRILEPTAVESNRAEFKVTLAQ